MARIYFSSSSRLARFARSPVAHNVVDVVRPLPPTNRNPSGHIPQNHAEPRLLEFLVADGIVADVVPNEGLLLPERGEQQRTAHVRPSRVLEEGEEEAEDFFMLELQVRGVLFIFESSHSPSKQQANQPNELQVVVTVVGLEQTASQQLLPDRPVLLGERIVVQSVDAVPDVVTREHGLVHLEGVVVGEGVGAVLHRSK